MKKLKSPFKTRHDYNRIAVIVIAFVLAYLSHIYSGVNKWINEVDHYIIVVSAYMGIAVRSPADDDK